MWTDEKARPGRKFEERKSETEKVRREKVQVREKVGESRNAVFSDDSWRQGSKNRLAEAAGAEPAGQMRDEKLHAVVARSTFRKKKCQKLTGTNDFWKLRCLKGGCEAHFQVKLYKNTTCSDQFFWK